MCVCYCHCTSDTLTSGSVNEGQAITGSFGSTHSHYMQIPSSKFKMGKSILSPVGCKKVGVMAIQSHKFILK